MLFTVEERTDLCSRLVAAARSDLQVTGAALVGSAAKGLDDRWSDIDLALQLAADANPADVADCWSDELRAEHRVAGTMDIYGADKTLFRVFLHPTLKTN